MARERDDDSDPDDRRWRPAASGASHVYVFPRAGEDLLKLGMSRDPLARLQSLHPRWFEFFDLEAGWILPVDRVREARALELRLSRLLAGHNAPAPLTVSRVAGGATEWYRGATAILAGQADVLLAQEYRLHRPLRHWLAPRLAEQSPLLFHWSENLLLHLAADPPPPNGAPIALEWTLLNGLDALPALGLPLQDVVSARVLEWRHAMRRRVGAVP